MKLVLFFLLLSAVCQTSSLQLGNSSWLCLWSVFYLYLRRIHRHSNVPGWTNYHLCVCCADEAEASDLQHVDEGTNHQSVDESGDVSGDTQLSDLRVTFQSICSSSSQTVFSMSEAACLLMSIYFCLTYVVFMNRRPLSKLYWHLTTFFFRNVPPILWLKVSLLWEPWKVWQNHQFHISIYYIHQFLF